MYRYRRSSELNLIWLIIAINILVYLATIPFNREIVFWLGMRAATVFSLPWTIVTNLFVHGGFWHVFTNMLTLYFFGTYLIRLVGNAKFLFVYFAGGIVGNIFFIIYALSLGSPFISVIGASGAIFALGGALAVMRPKVPVIVFPLPVPIPLWVAVIGGFVILSFFPNIAWQAHLGGLVLGLLAGYFFRRRERYYF